MTEQTDLKHWAMLAEMAGLHEALAKFPADVADAATAAAQDLSDVAELNGTTEPWPSMRVRTTR
jgi:hypothetical protein